MATCCASPKTSGRAASPADALRDPPPCDVSSISQANVTHSRTRQGSRNVIICTGYRSGGLIVWGARSRRRVEHNGDEPDDGHRREWHALSGAGTGSTDRPGTGERRGAARSERVAAASVDLEHAARRIPPGSRQPERHLPGRTACRIGTGDRAGRRDGQSRCYRATHRAARGQRLRPGAGDRCRHAAGRAWEHDQRQQGRSDCRRNHRPAGHRRTRRGHAGSPGDRQ